MHIKKDYYISHILTYCTCRGEGQRHLRIALADGCCLWILQGTARLTVMTCHCLCHILTVISKTRVQSKSCSLGFLLHYDIQWLHVNPPAKPAPRAHPEETLILLTLPAVVSQAPLTPSSLSPPLTQLLIDLPGHAPGKPRSQKPRPYFPRLLNALPCLYIVTKMCLSL